MAKDYLQNTARKRSHASDINICRRLVRHFGQRKVRDILPSEIERYKEARRNQTTRMGTPVAVSTINRELACLKAMFGRLVRDGKLERNPIHSVRLFNEDHLQRERILTEEEYGHLLDSAPPLTRTIIEVGYETAMRLGEILNLTWDRVDLKQGFIRLTADDTKTRTRRTIPINSRLSQIISAKIRLLHCPYVFHRNGHRIRSIREGFLRACDRAQIENFHFHDLRHMAVTRWVKRGIPEKAIMAISGHKTRKVFDRYTNLTEGDLRDFLKTVDVRPQQSTVPAEIANSKH
ncbi:MAG: site-specific integrase [Pseudomonadota bacterium]